MRETSLVDGVDGVDELSGAGRLPDRRPVNRARAGTDGVSSDDPAALVLLVTMRVSGMRVSGTDTSVDRRLPVMTSDRSRLG